VLLGVLSSDIAIRERDASPQKAEHCHPIFNRHWLICDLEACESYLNSDQDL
jgi:hypothetical protein